MAGYKRGNSSQATVLGSTIFHHWLDQFHAWPRARQRWVRGCAWVLTAAVLILVGVALGRGLGFPNGLAARARTLAASNATLQNQIQSLQHQQQTDSTTLAAMRQTLASRDSEVQKLKRDQVFYAKLIGVDSDRSGLGVYSLALAPVANTQAWNFVVTLVNTAENADTASGSLSLSVEGVRAGKLTTLDWSSLAAPDAKNGLPFAFKFFQQLHGSFMLPKDFVPDHVQVTLSPQGGRAVTRKLDWKDSLQDRGIGSSAP
jgi:Family of unknown function (DUF6776)